MSPPPLHVHGSHLYLQRKSSPTRERSPSAQSDMDVSSSDEDGLISRVQERDDRDRKLYGRPADDGSSTLAINELQRVRLSRTDIVKVCVKPWFEEYVKGKLLSSLLYTYSLVTKGAFVRYLIGDQPGKGPVYRVCEIESTFGCFFYLS
jgi:RNA polymerase-associated protein RTF1